MSRYRDIQIFNAPFPWIPAFVGITRVFVKNYPTPRLVIIRLKAALPAGTAWFYPDLQVNVLFIARVSLIDHLATVGILRKLSRCGP